MAKQLLIIRHGKSDWAEPGTSDFDRPLNHRGNKNAPEMAERIIRKELVPELIVSSPAKRAITTAGHFAATWQIPITNIQQEATIYEANVTALLQVINKLSNNVEKVALVGHNPGLTDFINYLADAHIYNLPTAGVVVIDFLFDDWSLISQHTGSLFLFDCPKKTECS